jgi:septum formation protein
MRLILASASPRRLELLRSLGLTPEVRPVDLDEAPRRGERPEAMVLRLARAKAKLAAADGDSHDAVILAADTTVAIDGLILGKPSDPGDAARMLRLLSGRAHSVFTAIAVRAAASPARADGARALEADDVCESRVHFSAISAEDIAAYVATGEPMDKAGAYGIQAGGGRFVQRVEGSYANVVGLPVERLEPLLARLGLALQDIRNS